MILNVSGRTDIVAFYTEWFINRYKDGFLDVRNPFNPKLINRIYFKNVDAILFCTKNPIPILKYLKQINKPIIFQVTLTPYKEDIEPNVKSKTEIIEAIKEISNIIGIEYLAVRYDPVFISEKYNLEYHKKAFEKMCSLLEGYVNKIIISFLDDYKNVRKNEKIINFKEFTEDDYREIGINFSNSAKRHNMIVQTCFEQRNLEEYGFSVGEKEIIPFGFGEKVLDGGISVDVQLVPIIKPRPLELGAVYLKAKGAEKLRALIPAELGGEAKACPKERAVHSELSSGKVKTGC